MRRQPQRFEDYVPHEQIAFETLTSPIEQEDYSYSIIVMKSTSDPDTMYLWQAQKKISRNFRQPCRRRWMIIPQEVIGG
jgi:hypothetical protein